MIRTVLLTIFLMSAWSAHANTAQRVMENMQHAAWRTQDDAPADIWAMAQSADGYLWLGTGSGLYRFDGMEFTPISLDGQAPVRSRNITALLITRDGCLWMGYYTGGASRMCSGSIRHFGIGDGVSGGMVFNFSQDAHGDIWMASARGLARFQSGSWRVLGPDAGYPSDKAHWVLCDQSGTIWAATGTTIVRKQRHDANFNATGIPSGAYAVMAQAPDGTIWSSDLANGTRLIAGKRPSTITPQLVAALATRVAKRMMFARDGTLWASDAQDGGVFSIEGLTDESSHPSYIETFGRHEGLTARDAVPLLQDAEGNVWTGTNLGLDSFRPKNIHSLPLPGARKPTIYDWTLDEANNLIVRTEEGAYLASNKHGIPLAIALPSRSSVIAYTGSTWWLVSGNALVRVQDGYRRRFVLPGNSTDADVLAATVLGDGTLFMSLQGAGLYRFKDDAWNRTLLPGPDPSALLSAGAGVWAAGGEHIAWLPSTGEVATYRVQVGGITALARTSKGILAVGDGGIAIQSGTAFTSIPANRFGSPAAITGAVVDRQGVLWLNGIRGIWRLPLAELYKSLENPEQPINFQQLDSQDGAPGVALQSTFRATAWIDRHDTLWFATNGGIAWIEPASMHYNQIPPRVFIRPLPAALPESAQVSVLPEGTTSVDFRYTATSLSVPKRVLFRTRLLGAVTQWSTASNQRQVSYANLKPGHYTFQVLASNNDGVWNLLPASLSFEIRPTFMQSKWFLVTCIVTGALVILAAYLFQMRQIAMAIKLRLKERFGERERIARELHDTLIQGFQGLVLRFDAIYRKIPVQLVDVRRDMEDAIARAEEVLGEGRDRVGDIRMEVDQSQDLSQALEQIKTEVQLEAQARLEVYASQACLLSPLCRDEVYRIGREAILNAFRHSHATLIAVTLDYRPDALFLEVRDNGLGLDDHLLKGGGRSGHWGLPGMRERAKRLRASLTFTVDEGTRVELRVPAAYAYENPRFLHRFLLSMIKRPEHL